MIYGSNSFAAFFSFVFSVNAVGQLKIEGSGTYIAFDVAVKTSNSPVAVA